MILVLVDHDRGEQKDGTNQVARQTPLLSPSHRAKQRDEDGDVNQDIAMQTPEIARRMGGFFSFSHRKTLRPRVIDPDWSKSQSPCPG